jgi:flagellar motor switch protein FliN/FliY
VIDMARSPDDPVELLVGDRLIARGEVVIVGGNYGVRVTELAGRRKEDLEERA